jgi:glycosyltransferase involved in cell wall biosynthesis
MKISLIYPLFKEHKRLAASLQDIRSFLQKLPLEVEIILVIDPSRDSTLEIARQTAEKFPQVKVLENKKRLGRGPSVHEGLSVAEGEVLFVGAIDLNIPLAEYFNTLQDFVINKDTAFIIGNRKSLKKPRHGEKKKWQKIFEQIEEEKLKTSGFSVSDPTCQFVAFRRPAFEKLKNKVERVPRWFYAGAYLAAANQSDIQISEKPVTCHDSKDSRFRWWQALF